MAKHDWIVIDISKYPTILRCKRCGEEQKCTRFPCRIEIYVALIKEFAKLHKNCKEKKNE